jgi:hypothetical protein
MVRLNPATLGEICARTPHAPTPNVLQPKHARTFVPPCTPGELHWRLNSGKGCSGPSPVQIAPAVLPACMPEKIPRPVPPCCTTQRHFAKRASTIGGTPKTRVGITTARHASATLLIPTLCIYALTLDAWELANMPLNTGRKVRRPRPCANMPCAFAPACTPAEPIHGTPEKTPAGRPVTPAVLLFPKHQSHLCLNHVPGKSCRVRYSIRRGYCCTVYACTVGAAAEYTPPHTKC